MINLVEFQVITVSKIGEIYRVPVDLASGRPVTISSYNEEPPGAFMQTYTSLAELRGAFQGCEFKYLEPPQRPENTLRKSPETAREAEVLMGKHASIPAAQPVTKAHTTSVVCVHNDARLLHAQEFLLRLKTAHQYASKKNQRELETKIAAVEELIAEVFKE